MKWIKKNKFPVRDSRNFVAAAEFGSMEQMTFRIRDLGERFNLWDKVHARGARFRFE